MNEDFIERVKTYVGKGRAAEYRLEVWTKRMTSARKKKHAVAFIRHLNISGSVKTLDMIRSPQRLAEFGELAWRLERAIHDQKRLRYGVRFDFTWHEAEQEWHVTFMDSIRENDAHKTRVLETFKGGNFPTAADRAIEAVPTLKRPGYT